MTAVYYDNKKMVFMLLNSNANLDLLDIGSHSVLDLAIEMRNQEIIDSLLTLTGFLFCVS
jgi:hypothetical protein